MADEQSAQILTDEERSRGIRRCIWEGALCATWGTLISGVFLTGLALIYGASDLQIGWLAAIPFFTGLVQLPAAALLERFGGQKRTTLWAAGLTRGIWIFALLTPVAAAAGADSRAILLLLTVQGAAGLGMAVTSVAWLSWLGNLIPRAERGTQIGRRSSLYAAASIVVGLAGGRFLDWWSGHRGGSDPGGFLLLYVLAVTVGMVGIWMLRAVPEPPRVRAPSRRRMLAILRRPWRDARFLRLSAYTAVRVFAVMFASPFFLVYQIKVLRMSYSLIAAYQAVHGLTNALGLQIWGRLSDRYGSRPVVILCALGISLLPLMWLFTTPENYSIVPFIFMLGGISWAGVSIGETNLLLKLAPPGRNATYIALYATIANLMATVAPLAGGLVSEAAIRVSFHIGPVHFDHFKILFLCSGLGRMLAVLVLRPLREPQELGVRRLVSALVHPRLPNPVLVLHHAIASLSGGRVAMEERLPTAAPVDVEAGNGQPLENGEAEAPTEEETAPEGQPITATETQAEGNGPETRDEEPPEGLA